MAIKRSSSIVFNFLCWLLCLPASVGALRKVHHNSVELQTVDGPRKHDVHLLVTRHGLSCTQLSAELVGWWDFGRSRILDPRIAGAARIHAQAEGKSEVSQWLRQQNLTVDAVLSSVLMRAMETAYLTYGDLVDKMYVAPFIRETKPGDSNSPDTKEAQLQVLNQTVPAGFQVDYKWVEAYGRIKSSWDDFLMFLQNDFIPALLKEHPKKSGEPIVLAVVTHSAFVNEVQDIAEQCQHFWLKKGSKKILNNQVVDVQYELHGREEWEAREYELFFPSTRTCREAASGMQLKDDDGHKPKNLCLSDLGESCISFVRQNSLRPQRVMHRTLEWQMKDIAKQILKSQKRRKHPLRRRSAKVQAAHLKQEQELLESLQQLKQESCWFGGLPRPADLYQHSDVAAEAREIMESSGGVASAG